MLMGGLMVVLSESLMLAEKAGVSNDTLLQILQESAVGSRLIQYVLQICCNLFLALSIQSARSKGPAMRARTFETSFPLKHQHKDMRLALDMATDLALALPASAVIKDRYDLAEKLGHSNQDFSAVHEILTGKASR